MSFRVGDTVGEYKIVAPLGRGGMGQVFRVEHTLTKRIEAMKVLMKHPLEGAEPVSRFLREVKIHASLNHPNIVTVHNAFQVGDDLALVMELVEGRSLKQLIQEGGLPLASALRSICGALEGLEYAHQHNVIHRDISASNVIVTGSGVAKLMDFGLSKVVAEPGLGQSGVVLGTVYYCSPEQVRGSTSLDGRSDVYSIGVVLYEVVTGRRPFESETAFNIMMDHIQTPPVAPHEVNPEVPGVLSDIILKALAKDPADRFQSAGDLRRSLAGVLDSVGSKSAARSASRAPFWHSLADDCIRLSGLRSVQVGLVALGLAFPATVVCVNALSYRAGSPEPPAARWSAPPVPAGALQLSSLPPAAPVKAAIVTKRVSESKHSSLIAEQAAPAATPALAKTAPAAVVSEPAPASDDLTADPAPQAEPQRKTGLRRFFGKMFHRKTKPGATTDDPGEQGAAIAARP
jgi:eukaryotic-like serine/threonine-protein kinase